MEGSGRWDGKLHLLPRLRRLLHLRSIFVSGADVGRYRTYCTQNSKQSDGLSQEGWSELAEKRDYLPRCPCLHASEASLQSSSVLQPHSATASILQGAILASMSSPFSVQHRPTLRDGSNNAWAL
jgi:hypothetical protein